MPSEMNQSELWNAARWVLCSERLPEHGWAGEAFMRNGWDSMASSFVDGQWCNNSIGKKHTNVLIPIAWLELSTDALPKPSLSQDALPKEKQ